MLIEHRDFLRIFLRFWPFEPHFPIDCFLTKKRVLDSDAGATFKTHQRRDNLVVVLLESSQTHPATTSYTMSLPEERWKDN